MVDLERDRVLDDEKREAAVSYYTKDFAYERSLQAGAKRIDLSGKEVGTVTEQEEREAKARVQAAKKEKREREAANNAPAITVMRRLHDNGQIATDMLRKIDAPPITKEITMAKTKPEFKTAASPFAGIRSLLDDAEKTLPERQDLRRAYTIAGLRVVISECETAIADLEDRKREFHFSETEQPY